jgi:hypothetical protein
MLLIGGLGLTVFSKMIRFRTLWLSAVLMCLVSPLAAQADDSPGIHCIIEQCFIITVCTPSTTRPVCTSVEACSETEIPCPTGGLPL